MFLNNLRADRGSVGAATQVAYEQTELGASDVSNLNSSTYADVPGLSLTFEATAGDHFRAIFRVAASVQSGSGTANFRLRLVYPDGSTAAVSNGNAGSGVGFPWGKKSLSQTGNYTLAVQYKISSTLVLQIRANTQTDTEIGFLSCDRFSA